MKSRILVGLVLAMGVGSMTPGVARAAVNILLYVQGQDENILVNNKQVPVPESCAVTDTDGVAHDFSGFRAVCALQTAKDTGLITDFTVKNSPPWGLFLESVNGIAGMDVAPWHFWNLWKNAVHADVGIVDMVLGEGDTLQLTYGEWQAPIINVASRDTPSGGPVVLDVFPRSVNVERAVSFLVAQQSKKDGSFGHPLLTDWAAIALGAYEGKSATALAAKESLKDWLAAHPVPNGGLLTDYERRAMAFMALGVNPYSGTSQNTIEAILQGFDGEQFGNPGLVNDDIFAVLVLKKAGYEENVTPLLETIPFILSWQAESGSLGGVDLTAAAVQVLSLLSEGETKTQALVKARDYLALQQERTGGFGNAYSTSWVLQAIAALNEDGNAWAIDVDKRTPEHFLALHQARDGGLFKDDSPENRVWATSYAIPAALSKSWGDVLRDFEKPVSVQPIAQPSAQELSEEEQTALEVQVAMLQNEIAQVEQQIAVAKQLAAIERELTSIAQKVHGLQPQVAMLHAAYLAGLEAKTQGMIAQEEPVQDLSQFVVLEDELAALTEEPVSEEQENQQLTAQAVGTSENFFATGSGQAVLVLGVGIAIFFALGGWRVVLSLVRRPQGAV